jgi:transcription initiation factor IIF auxiliary subunit
MKNKIFTKWDNTTTLRSYVNQMDLAIKEAAYRNVQGLPQDCMDHLLVSQIYANNPFETKVMTGWETRKVDLKTWDRCKIYFIKEAKKLKIHKKATAKQSCYYSAANVKEEEASETEENVNLVLKAMQASTEQMNAVALANTKNEATIAKLGDQIGKLNEMNANLVQLVVKLEGKPSDKDNAAEVEKNGNGGKQRKTQQRKLKLCEYCDEKHPGAGKYCLARKCNAHLCGSDWKGKEVDK